MKKGFTLSEVLITLGIIGVVAAVTLPGLVQNYQKQATCNKLKKMYNNLNSIVKMAENDNGEVSTWNFSETGILLSNTIFYKTYFKPYLITIKKDYVNVSFNGNYSTVLYDITGNRITFQSLIWEILPDGTSIAFFNEGSYFRIFADLNGHKYPNRIGKDVFMFSLNKKKGLVEFIGINYDIYTLKHDSSYGCTKDISSAYAGGYCGALIMKNNWKMPENYPW